MPATDILRKQLIELIDGHGAHLPFDEAALASARAHPDDAVGHPRLHRQPRVPRAQLAGGVLAGP